MLAKIFESYNTLPSLARYYSSPFCFLIHVSLEPSNLSLSLQPSMLASPTLLNSVVLANNKKMILLLMNKLVFGTKRRSQIQKYLEHNGGD